MILDELSFDIRHAPGIKVPEGYGRHFNSFDGKERSFIVEGAGGPTWFTEYSVLTGLSARSFGRFAYFVTRIAAGRVERGLPHALRRCGYKTFTLYPARGAFMSARSFQTTAGVQQFLRQQGYAAPEASSQTLYFYDQAAQVIARERANGPLFIFSYLAANHFPWDYTFRPDLTPDWRKLGNAPHIDEYVRRQGMSERDYAAFLERLRRDFPDESFMLVRFGDHQPDFAERIIDPNARRRRDRGPAGRLRSPLFHDLLRDRHRQFQTGRCVVGARRRWKRRICRWSSRKRPACRSIRPSPSRSGSCNAARACSTAAPTAPRRAVSTGS